MPVEPLHYQSGNGDLWPTLMRGVGCTGIIVGCARIFFAILTFWIYGLFGPPPREFQTYGASPWKSFTFGSVMFLLILGVALLCLGIALLGGKRSAIPLLRICEICALGYAIIAISANVGALAEARKTSTLSGGYYVYYAISEVSRTAISSAFSLLAIFFSNIAIKTQRSGGLI